MTAYSNHAHRINSVLTFVDRRASHHALRSRRQFGGAVRIGAVVGDYAYVHMVLLSIGCYHASRSRAVAWSLTRRCAGASSRRLLSTLVELAAAVRSVHATHGGTSYRGWVLSVTSFN